MLRFNVMRLLALSFVLTAVPALAQFEVSPDHFDSPSQKTVQHHAQAKTRTRHTQATAAKTGNHKETIAKSKKRATPVTTTVASR